MYKQLTRYLIGRCLATPVRTFLWRSKGNHQRSAGLAAQTLRKEVTWLTPLSPPSVLGVPTLEPDILEKVDLFGCAAWEPEDQWEAQSILREYADVFTKDDLDLGWTSIVRHKITLEDGARPIKECYRRVPPGLYDEIQKHLQEMVDVRAIWPSNSPWASAIVLVRKKKEVLWWCSQ